MNGCLQVATFPYLFESRWERAASESFPHARSGPLNGFRVTALTWALQRARFGHSFHCAACLFKLRQ